LLADELIGISNSIEVTLLRKAIAITIKKMVPTRKTMRGVPTL
jgi:hypothetical protein